MNKYSVRIVYDSGMYAGRQEIACVTPSAANKIYRLGHALVIETKSKQPTALLIWQIADLAAAQR